MSIPVPKKSTYSNHSTTNYCTGKMVTDTLWKNDYVTTASFFCGSVKGGFHGVEGYVINVQTVSVIQGYIHSTLLSINLFEPCIMLMG